MIISNRLASEIQKDLDERDDERDAGCGNTGLSCAVRTSAQIMEKSAMNSASQQGIQIIISKVIGDLSAAEKCDGCKPTNSAD